MDRTTSPGARCSSPGAIEMAAEGMGVDAPSFVKGSRYAYCPYIVGDARAKRYGLSTTDDPIPGDVVVYDWSYDTVYDHVGIFEKDMGGGPVLRDRGQHLSVQQLERRRGHAPHALPVGPGHLLRPGERAVSGWEIAAPVLLGVLLIGLLIFSVLKPSSMVKFGIFVERRLMNKRVREPPPEPPSPDQADTKEIKKPDAW